VVLDAGTEWVPFVEEERSWRVGKASERTHMLFSNAIITPEVCAAFVKCAVLSPKIMCFPKFYSQQEKHDAKSHPSG